MASLRGSRGYGETTVEELIALAGIERADFERLFDGKEHCATEAVKAILGETMSVVGASHSPDEVRAVPVSGVSLLCAMMDRRHAAAAQDEQPSATALGAFDGAETVVRRGVAGGRTERLPVLLPDLVYSAAVPFFGQVDALRLARRGRQLLAGGRG